MQWAYTLVVGAELFLIPDSVTDNTWFPTNVRWNHDNQKSLNNTQDIINIVVNMKQMNIHDFYFRTDVLGQWIMQLKVLIEKQLHSDM